MNIKQFIDIVNLKIEDMSESELKLFIYHIARTTPDYSRYHFLELFDILDGSVYEVRDHESLLKKASSIKDSLSKTSNEDYCIVEELNEEYDDWYGGPGEEFNYIDSFGIGAIVNEALNYIYECVCCRLSGSL